MAFWWVNHKQTFVAEVDGGYMWSPKTNKGGKLSHFYDNMLKASAGDLVVSYADTKVRAIGMVLAPAISSTRPVEFGKAGDNWNIDGWFVSVDFERVPVPLKPADHMDVLAPLLPEKYSPIRQNGNGNQGAYLSEISEELTAALLGLLGIPKPLGMGEEAAETAIRNRTDIGPTTKDALVKARRGQGVYRSNLEGVEKACRLTGVSDRRFLVASHIKAWAISSDFEKLDGNNGLLLSPPVDKLFDRGMISFSDSGQLLCHPSLPEELLTSWGLPSAKQTGSFNPAQKWYLKHHRLRHGLQSL